MWQVVSGQRVLQIFYDTHIDMTLETHPILFMKRPEMAIDITVTTT